MKNRRFLGLALAASLALMGTAYAAWTQSINVSSTVAIGQLEVEVQLAEAVGVIDGDSQGQGSVALLPATAEIVDGFSRITFSGGNFFPNTEYRTKLFVENKGSIPADADIFIPAGTVVNMPVEDVTYRIASYALDGSMTESQPPELVASASTIEQAVANFGTVTIQPQDKKVIWLSVIFEEEADEDSVQEDHGYGFIVDVDISQFNID